MQRCEVSVYQFVKWHTQVDHDQKYTRFDIIGEEIFYFLNNGVFTKEARREKYNWDPFKKIKNL